MAGKQFELTGVGDITIVKRASSRNIRLSIRSDGQVMVSIPSWANYKAGLKFAESKRDWLLQHVKPVELLQDGQAVGKHHHLELKPTQGIKAPRSLVSKTTITVRYPLSMQSDSPEVQKLATSACIRALRAQAEQLLPGRLQSLAEQHNFTYKSVTVKQLKGRWGSCDSQKNIVLNLFLMQIPWNCIDYVLLHELTHTQVMQHGPPFWQRMEGLVPNLKLVRLQMRGFKPVLQARTDKPYNSPNGA